MYAVSDASLTAVQSKTRRYDWTGVITTAGTPYVYKILLDFDKMYGEASDFENKVAQ